VDLVETMARKVKQEAKPLPQPAKPRKRTVSAPSVLPKPPPQKTKPRQKRKPKTAKVAELVLLDSVLGYLGNYLLVVGVSAVIVGLAYWFMDAFD
jgi:hypothetical protein